MLDETLSVFLLCSILGSAKNSLTSSVLPVLLVDALRTFGVVKSSSPYEYESADSNDMSRSGSPNNSGYCFLKSS